MNTNLTTDSVEQEHVDGLTLSDYFFGRLTEIRQQVIEEHLAGCDLCTSLSRKVFRLLVIESRASRSRYKTATTSGATIAGDRAV